MTDYIISNLWLFWTIAFILLLILELSTGTFFIMCFAIGSLFSVVAALFGVPFLYQMLVFAVFSAASIFVVRPFVMKYLHSDDSSRLSNAEAIIGRVGTVSETIVAGGHGRVKIDGDDWKAVSIDGTPIELGAKVEVVSIDSIIITVRPTA